MCVSTAYKNTESGPVLAEYIAAVKQQEGNVVMTDVMGIQTTVEGVIKSADLTKGVLIIEQS